MSRSNHIFSSNEHRLYNSFLPFHSFVLSMERTKLYWQEYWSPSCDVGGGAATSRIKPLLQCANKVGSKVKSLYRSAGEKHNYHDIARVLRVAQIFHLELMRSKSRQGHFVD